MRNVSRDLGHFLDSHLFESLVRFVRFRESQHSLVVVSSSEELLLFVDEKRVI